MKRYISIFFTFVMIVFLVSCPMGGPDPGPEPDPDPDPDETFKWSNPKSPDGVSVFDVSELAADAKARGSRSAASWLVDSSGKTITPDNVKVAYRYIAMITEDVTEDIDSKGFFGVKHDSGTSDWEQSNVDDYLDGPDYAKIPGFDSSHTGPGIEGNISFEAYIDDNTPVNASQAKTGAFEIFDGTNGTADLSDDTVKVFDLSNDTLSIEVEEVPPEGVGYCGIATELIYYEAEISGYGLIRHYYNDFRDFSAGDMVVKKGEDDWQWVYLQHGNGPDTTNIPSVNPGYDQVNAPDDPENPSGSWSMHDYTGTFNLHDIDTNFSDIDIPVFMHDNLDWWSKLKENPANNSKRPSGVRAYVYWMATNLIMNGPAETQYTEPKIDEDTNPGGFDSYDSSNPKDSTPISFSDPNPVISGVYKDESGGTGGDDAYLVYYEPDDHLGQSDMSTVLYSTTRKTDDEIISREDMTKRFGVYAYDSGLITHVYDDRKMVPGRNHLDQTYYKYPTLLDLSMGRICVTAFRKADSSEGPGAYTYTAPDPASPDALYESIVKVDVEFEIMVDMGFGEDCAGRSWDGGTSVTESDFPGRFIGFIPDLNGSSDYANWGTDPNDPVPAQRGFYGAGSDDHGLEASLSFRLARFHIDMHNVRYAEVYSMPPQLRPNPEEGPFSTADFPPVYVQYDYPFLADTFNFYYTLDGTDPDESSTPFPYPSGYDIGLTDTHLKVIAVEEGKEPSKIVDAWYVFEEAGGSAVEVTISNNPAPDGTGVFIGLFLDDSLNLDQELAPVYSEFGTLSGGGVTCTFANVDDGYHYLAAIVDVDDNKKLSTGDYLYPDSVTDMIVSLREVVSSAANPVYIDIDTDWYTVP